MNLKAVFAYLVLLIVLVVVAFVVLPTQSGKTTTVSTTAGPTTVSAATTSSNTTTTISGLISTNYTSCTEKNNTQAIPNGFFTKNYTSWNVSGVGFGSAPLNLTQANLNGTYYGHPWSGFSPYIFAASTYHGNLLLVGGNITSSTFVPALPYLNFKIISPQSDSIYVEIIHNNQTVITSHFDTYDVPGNDNATSNFENASINLVPVICEPVKIKVVDDLLGSNKQLYELLAVTGFHLSRTPSSAAGLIVNQTYNSN